MTDLTALRDLVRGQVTLPDDDDFDVDSMPWNVAVHQQPRAVIAPQDAADAAAVVRAAADLGFVMTTQPGGHGANESLNGTVLVRTSAFDAIDIDTGSATATSFGHTQR